MQTLKREQRPGSLFGQTRRRAKDTPLKFKKRDISQLTVKKFDP